MKSVNNYTKEPQLLSAILTGICLEMLTNTIEWEASLNKVKTDVEDILDQFNKYAALGIIDEYQCAYVSLKNYFRSVVEQSEGLCEVVKKYRKELLESFFTSKYEKELPSIEHESKRDIVLDFLSTFTYKMNEFNAIFNNISFSVGDLCY